MTKTLDPIQVTPQQIHRFVDGKGWSNLADAKDEVEDRIGKAIDTTGWDVWERKGIRTSDLSSAIAQEITDMIHGYEEGSLILFPLEVRAWREGMGMSQPEASEFLGVARTTLSRWEQRGIVDEGVGTTAHALAASVTSKDPERLAERTRTIPILLDFLKAAGREAKTDLEAAVAISRWGSQGGYARLGLGSFGLYRLLKDAWETMPCLNCFAKSPTDARFCSACGQPFNREVT